MKMTQTIILMVVGGLVWLVGYAGAEPNEGTEAAKTTAVQQAPAPEKKLSAGEHSTKVLQTSSHSGADVSSATQTKLGPAPVESDWRDRGMKWFKSTDMKGRRKEMRAVTRALKRPCKYCHTRDFKGFVGHRTITQQMMAMSVEHNVACSDCHAGRDAWTEMGERSKSMWKIVHQRKVFCEHCHLKNRRFEGLTEAGQAFKDEGKKN
ncbi:MAG: hypothetical protein VX589_04780 [Myxococcota bacterium]|nr:hypothetical protein [Myxococcota bacterium]